MQEVTGNLASGNTFRATSYMVQILDADGAVLKTIDVNDIASVTRTGQTVTVVQRNGERTELIGASIDDAGRLESTVRPVTPVIVQPEKKRGFGKKLGLGCLGLIGLIVGIVIIAAVASGGGDDDDSTTGNTGSTSATKQPGTDSKDRHASLAVNSSGEVESLSDRKAKVTINQIQDDAKSSNSFIQPKAGNRYYALQVTVEAVGGKTVSSGSWRLRAKDGFEYDQTFISGLEGESLAFGDITPGGKRQGWVVFEIPTGAQVQWVRYDENVVVAGDLFFDAA